MAGVHISQATKFCTVVPDIISIIITYTHKNVYQFSFSEPKATQNSDVHGPLTNFWASIWKLFNVTILAPGIWPWFLGFWKISGLLIYGGKSSKNMLWKFFQYNVKQNGGCINMYVFKFRFDSSNIGG